jgi:hypothetical protein
VQIEVLRRRRREAQPGPQPIQLTHLLLPPFPHPPQLTYRTFNRDYGLPNCNDDHLAPLMRDALMPERGRMHRERDPGLWYRNRCLDMRYLGVPGEAGGGGQSRWGVKSLGAARWQREREHPAAAIAASALAPALTTARRRPLPPKPRPFRHRQLHRRAHAVD